MFSHPPRAPSKNQVVLLQGRGLYQEVKDSVMGRAVTPIGNFPGCGLYQEVKSLQCRPAPTESGR